MPDSEFSQILVMDVNANFNYSVSIMSELVFLNYNFKQIYGMY